MVLRIITAVLAITEEQPRAVNHAHAHAHAQKYYQRPFFFTFDKFSWSHSGSSICMVSRVFSRGSNGVSKIFSFKWVMVSRIFDLFSRMDIRLIFVVFLSSNAFECFLPSYFIFPVKIFLLDTIFLSNNALKSQNIFMGQFVSKYIPTLIIMMDMPNKCSTTFRPIHYYV